MKISYKWLKNYLKTNLSPQNIADILTNIGLEVESIDEFESIKGGLRNIVVGQVIECIKHPKSEKISLTKVDIGNNNVLDIVCGAPNVAKGQKVAVALPGAKVFKGNEVFTISEVTIYGSKSEGMICAEDEIGLGNSHEGIMILDNSLIPGTPLSEIYPVYQDIVFEISLTPNRIDAASHYGVARDLAAYLQHKSPVILEKPSVNDLKLETNKLPIQVIVENKIACPRYCGVVISQVEVKESPEWLKNYLLAIGQKPINNIVDITNFVLHEFGHPLHAFDYDKIKGNKVIIKTFADGTSFITLDGIERKLTSEDLVIANVDEPMCLAGVFGGLHSGVTENTKNVFIESAYFNPVWIRKTSRRHGLITESSFRFERGADINQTIYSLKRAANLIQEIAGGKIASEIIDIYPEKKENVTLEIEYSFIENVIGKKIPKETIKEILHSLEITIIAEKEKGLLLEIPTYRVDVTRPIDVVEEILRIYGFNNVDITSKVSLTLNQNRNINYTDKLQNSISNLLVSNGFYEIMTNSLSKISYYTNNNEHLLENTVTLLNPLSNDLAALRQTLLYSALEVVSYNINRQNNDLKLFEFGKCYIIPEASKNDKVEYYHEENRLSILITGNINPQTWIEPIKKTNFFFLKRWIDTVIKKCGILVTSTKEITTDTYNYALIYFNKNTQLVTFGKLSETLVNQFEIKQEVYFAEFLWDNVVSLASENKIIFKDIPKYPYVRRDLAMIIDESITYEQLKELAFRECKDILKEVNLFDIYKGEQIGKDKKSYAISYILQSSEHTLTDNEINKTMEILIQAYQKEFNAIIRM